MLNETTYTLSYLNKFFESLGVNADLPADKLKTATYFACMKIRCENVAKLPIRVYKSEDKGKAKATDFYLYDLLKLRPNPYMTSYDFMFVCEYHKLEFGNAYIYMDTSRGKVRGLYPLEPKDVEIWIDNAGIMSNKQAVWYIYKPKNGKEIKFKSDEIIHLKSFTKDGLIGKPIKEYLLETIENEQYSSGFLNNYFKNGVSGGAILNYTAGLDDKNVKKLRERFEEMTSGLKNAGRILPIPIGFKLEPFNVDLVSSEFFNIQGLTIRHIANAFGVKLFQLNDLERSTYGNVETQNRAFYTDTLLSVLTQAEQEFDYKLLTPSERMSGYYIKFNVDSILRGDFKTRMEGYSIAVQNAIYTPAECRELEERSFIEGSDKLVCNGNMIKLDDVGKGGDNIE